MSLCDDPEFVSIGNTWDETKKLKNRIPIVVTGNSLDNIFAPLIRDGRMDKFYWRPERHELIETVYQLFRDDHVTKKDVEVIIDMFPGQSLDFFGAVRSATYDVHVRAWIEKQMGGRTTDPRTDMTKLGPLLIRRGKNGEVLKEHAVPFEAPIIELEALLREGKRIVQEQEFVRQVQLAPEYMRMQKGNASMIGLRG